MKCIGPETEIGLREELSSGRLPAAHVKRLQHQREVNETNQSTKFEEEGATSTSNNASFFVGFTQEEMILLLAETRTELQQERIFGDATRAQLRETKEKLKNAQTQIEQLRSFVLENFGVEIPELG